MNQATIGIDVSKEKLDAHRLPGGKAASFTNDEPGLQALIDWIGRGPIARVVFEPTGRYHRALERCLTAAGLPLIKVNPRHARRFAEALGTQAKTDRVDAALLAKMGAALELAPKPARPETLNQLNELITARRALIKDRTAAKNRAKGVSLALLRRQHDQRLKRIKADLAVLDQAIAELIESQPDLAERHAILVSIPGIADITAAAILALAPELGSLDQRQVAALAGLAPRDRQSGRWKGKASIGGGRAQLRQATYMPALAAMRFNDDFKTFARRLQQERKPPKVVITAVMRKLIILANALLRDNRTWSNHAP